MTDDMNGYSLSMIGRINFKYDIVRIKGRLYVVESSDTKNLWRYLFPLFPLFPKEWRAMEISENELSRITYKKFGKSKAVPFAVTTSLSFVGITMFIGKALGIEKLFGLGHIDPNSYNSKIILLIIAILYLLIVLLLYLRKYGIKGAAFEPNTVIELQLEESIEKQRRKMMLLFILWSWVLMPAMIYASFLMSTIPMMGVIFSVALAMPIAGFKIPLAFPNSNDGQKYQVIRI